MEDFKIVIDKKISEWRNTEFKQYLNPFTLFSDKFELYLNQKTKVKSKEEYLGSGDRNRASSKRNFSNSDTKRVRFNNFKGRDFDYEKIEDQLLGWA